MSKPGQGAGGGWFSGGAASAQLPDWFWPAGQTAGAGPQDLVRAMRALVGTPFAPLSRGQLLIQLGVGALAFVYLLLGSLGEDGDAGPLVGGAIGGLMVLVVMYGQRLDAMYRKRSAEPDELALLPGFGDAQQQRMTLARAVSWSPLWATVTLLVLLVAIGAAVGLGIPALALLLMTVIGVAMMMALACLRPLAGLRLDAWRMLLLAGPGMLLAMITMIYATRAAAFGTMAQVLAVLWVLGYAIGGAALGSTVRRFRVRPHPFLQD